MTDGVTRPVVVVVGAGFGGLRAARRLARLPVRVILVDRHNYHLFQPLLYQVATAGVEPDQIAKPVRAILRGQKNLEFRLADVTGVDLAGRRIETDRGPIAYDYLILAPGGQTNFFGRDALARAAFGLKDLDEAIAIRSQILRAFERAATADDREREALLTFAVAGGGPTGVEMAGALSELIRLVLVKDHPGLDLARVRVLLLEAGPAILPAMPPSLGAAAVRTLQKKKVEVRVGAAVEDYDGGRIRLKGGETIPARTLLWAAGVKAAGLAGALGAATGRQGRVMVDETLRLPGHPEVFVIGDASYREAGGEPLPMMAPVAIQMGESAVANIGRALRGKPARPFRYRNPGSLATIGRNAAVAEIHGLRFKGFPAWVVWLVVHLIQLIGFRNKLVVLINWAWDYFFFERGPRLISGG